LRIWVPVEK
jgi:hypothetical protein